MRHTSVRIAAPAKVNLGLEIVGRREDGYHEIRSILAMLDLADDLTLTRLDSAGQTRIEGMPGVRQEDNLITHAVEAFAAASGEPQAWHIKVTKRVPAPAGLGAASSDAAATLLALNAVAANPLDDTTLYEVASSLGSDVPFFLDATCAKVSGTGTDVHPLPPPYGYLLVAVPPSPLEAKTARLYGALEPIDFSNGSTIDMQAHRLQNGEALDTSLLGNAFERPLASLMPELHVLRTAMQAAGCGDVALSGAGPAHYAIFDDEATAHAAAGRLAGLLETPLSLPVTRFRHDPITAVIGMTSQ